MKTNYKREFSSTSHQCSLIETRLYWESLIYLNISVHYFNMNICLNWTSYFCASRVQTRQMVTVKYYTVHSNLSIKTNPLSRFFIDIKQIFPILKY